MSGAPTDDRPCRVVITLGELVAAVASVAREDREVTAVVSHLFRTGVCLRVASDSGAYTLHARGSSPAQR